MAVAEERHTNASESSSLESQKMKWLTPTTMDIERTPEGIKKRIAYRESVGRQYVEGCLTEQIKNWSTPVATEARQEYQRRDTTKKAFKNMPSLTTLAVDLFGHPVQEKPSSPGKNPESWATPRVSPGMTQTVGYSQKSIQEKGYKARLEESVAMTQPENRKTGQLNPNWVEQLMGLPVGWTQLPAAWMQPPTE
tara:strand:+ start:160 stop:741 length:582 start_codon:yes stop_codon:yes gene_type:complete